MSMDYTAVAAPAPGYPVRLDVEYPAGLSRWMIFVKWLLAIPHFVVLYFLQIISELFLLIAFFAILFTKKFPRGLFDFVVNVYRWQVNVTAYAGLMRDEYPPFSWDAGKYPVTLEVDYPEELNRWLPLVKWLLAIPHFIALFFVFIVAILLWIIAFFAILITGQFPRGMFDFIVGTLRWQYRVNAYVYFMRDEYPPFSLK
ncbi:MAG TPA: DUF4389 domain-containing protein [Dehalococcoidia bacterium]|nr:DUF4389 domain-containing protein [Dehalococcoidia bacterium]